MRDTFSRLKGRRDRRAPTESGQVESAISAIVGQAMHSGDVLRVLGLATQSHIDPTIRLDLIKRYCVQQLAFLRSGKHRGYPDAIGEESLITEAQDYLKATIEAHEANEAKEQTT